MLPQCYPNYKTVHRRFQTWPLAVRNLSVKLVAVGGHDVSAVLGGLMTMAFAALGFFIGNLIGMTETSVVTTLIPYYLH